MEQPYMTTCDIHVVCCAHRTPIYQLVVAQHTSQDSSITQIPCSKVIQILTPSVKLRGERNLQRVIWRPDEALVCNIQGCPGMPKFKAKNPLDHKYGREQFTVCYLRERMVQVCNIQEYRGIRNSEPKIL